ncbi:MAG TPA: hypothetical protein VGJ17_06735 [Candidatus Limnocylindrales bacterium]
MDDPNGQIATTAAAPTWRGWLLAAIAGTVAYLATLGAIDVVLDPGRATGNTSVYASIVIGLVAGTVVAGLALRARSATRWIAAFLLTLLSVAGLGLVFLSYWYLTLGI